MRHKLIVVHGVQGAVGFTIVGDSTESVYATARPELLEFLGSLSIEP